MGHVDALRSNGTEAARIVGLVRGLSERTRILALNTMIEAARAGVSGRAMAAIATSIRSLAEDAATGTEAISATIDASSEHIAQVATAIEKVAAIAKEVQHYQGAIATAVEQQTQVTGDVARSAHQAERLGADVRRQLEQLGLGIDVGAEQPLR
jgi:methyl-accepting chemotaxis protein